MVVVVVTLIGRMHVPDRSRKLSCRRERLLQA
jgi:hypothetical protein